jgi:hypothetical protein
MQEDVLTLVTADHRRLQQLFERIQREPDEREESVPMLAALLLAHLQAEGAQVYPAIAATVPGQESAERVDQADQAEVEQLLHKLEACDLESEEFDEALGALRDAVLNHVDEQENEVLPALAEAVPPRRLSELGLAFAEVRAQELEDAGFSRLVNEMSFGRAGGTV